MSSSYTIFFTNNTVWRWMYENGSIQRSNIRTYGLVLKSAKKIHLWSSSHYPWSIILLGVECSKMVAFNALTSGYMTSCLNQLKKLICHLHTQYFLPIILFGVECREMVELALKTYLWSSWTIFLTNNTIWRWIYENDSIQRSNIRTYEFVLESAK